MFGHQITYQMILLDWSPEQFGEICGVRFQWSTILTGCESWNKNWFLNSSSTKWKNDIIILLCDIRSPPFPVVMSFSHLWNVFAGVEDLHVVDGHAVQDLHVVDGLARPGCEVRFPERYWWLGIGLTDPGYIAYIMKEMGDVYERQVGYVLLRK